MTGRIAPAVWGIAVAITLPEIVLAGADLGLWGSPGWRGLAFAYGAFWPGLLGNWHPNYPGQAAAMFVTYGFLHGGLAHLALNALTLFSLSPPIVRRVGQVRYLVLYALSLFGGAVGYAALATEPLPMVGASGALFGLAGAILGWELADRLRRHLAYQPIARALMWLVLLNLLMWWAMDGQLAWQTHLGGFVAGWFYAWIVRRPIRA